MLLRIIVEKVSLVLRRWESLSDRQDGQEVRREKGALRIPMHYYSANILSVNRFVDFSYEKLSKNHSDDISEVIFPF